MVHLEITGHDPAAPRRFYSQLFGWEFDTGGPVVEAVSDYGFADPGRTTDGAGIPGGVGGGEGYEPHVLFYVGVVDAEAALQQAERFGATRRMGAAQAPGRDLIVCRVMGVTAISLFMMGTLVARNAPILDGFEARTSRDDR